MVGTEYYIILRFPAVIAKIRLSCSSTGSHTETPGIMKRGNFLDEWKRLDQNFYSIRNVCLGWVGEERTVKGCKINSFPRDIITVEITKANCMAVRVSTSGRKPTAHSSVHIVQ